MDIIYKFHMEICLTNIILNIEKVSLTVICLRIFFIKPNMALSYVNSKTIIFRSGIITYIFLHLDFIKNRQCHFFLVKTMFSLVGIR